MTKKKQHGGRREGAGRPREFENLSQPISVTLEQADLERLDTVAAKRKLTRLQAIREAIKKWVGRS